MQLSSLTKRLGDDAESAWRVHILARERQQKGEDILILSIGEETEEVTADCIVESAVKSLRAGRHHYTDVRGTEELRQAICNRHQQITGQAVGSDTCTVYCGAQNSLFAVALCLLESGDEVILPEPYYTSYPGVFCCTGATAVKVGGSHENLFLADIEEIERAVTPKTRAIVITQPGNPMGSYYGKEDLQRLVKFCMAKNIWLISDEVYTLLLAPDNRCSPATYDPEQKCVVTINSLSKSNRMTGWRMGWVVTPSKLADALAELSMIMHFGIPPFIMDAAVTALEEDKDTAENIRLAMNSRRQVCKEILEPLKNTELLDAGAGMFLILDVAGTGLSGEEFALRLLEEHAVATLPCTGFGDGCASLLRIGLCVPEEPLAIACKRIAEFADSIQ